MSHNRSSWARRDPRFEKEIRPRSLREFIAHARLLEKLEIFLGAAKKRKEALSHSLFYGPPGLGKTTLAHIVARELESQIIPTSAPAIEKAKDLAGILTSLKEGDVLFIDEIHRLHPMIEEYLYSAMEDFALDLVLDSGPQARTVRLPLKRFTLIGATTRMGQLSFPLRSRFPFTCRLDYYSPEFLSQILTRSSTHLDVEIDDRAIFEIARRSRGTPRVANNLLRWVRDYAHMRTDSKLDHVTIRMALEMLDIDCRGLDETDKRILHHIIDRHRGGPVGIKVIAAALGEESTTLEEVHEPFLIMEGFLKRSPRGREATELAYEHLGRSFSSSHPHLMEC